MMNLGLTQFKDGKLMLWVEDVPGFQLKPNETLIDCLRREIKYFREEVDKPMRGADPWANNYADTLENFLRSLNF